MRSWIFAPLLLWAPLALAQPQSLPTNTIAEEYQQALSEEPTLVDLPGGTVTGYRTTRSFGYFSVCLDCYYGSFKAVVDSSATTQTFVLENDQTFPAGQSVASMVSLLPSVSSQGGVLSIRGNANNTQVFLDGMHQ